jgi:hypothetical protein
MQDTWLQYQLDKHYRKETESQATKARHARTLQRKKLERNTVKVIQPRTEPLLPGNTLRKRYGIS